MFRLVQQKWRNHNDITVSRRRSSFLYRPKANLNGNDKIRSTVIVNTAYGNFINTKKIVVSLCECRFPVPVSRDSNSGHNRISSRLRAFCRYFRIFPTALLADFRCRNPIPPITNNCNNYTNVVTIYSTIKLCFQMCEEPINRVNEVFREIAT